MTGRAFKASFGTKGLGGFDGLFLRGLKTSEIHLNPFGGQGFPGPATPNPRKPVFICLNDPFFLLKRIHGPAENLYARLASSVKQLAARRVLYRRQPKPLAVFDR